MPAKLFLPSLTIEGFRGLRFLELPSFGRVTLLAGKNSSGKTTILEAVRLFASRGDNRSLLDLFETREELVLGYSEDGDEMLFPDFSSLFYESDNEANDPPNIMIGVKGTPQTLSLQLVEDSRGSEMPSLFSRHIQQTKALRVSFGKQPRTLSLDAIDYNKHFRRRFAAMQLLREPVQEEWPDPILNQSLGPGLPDNNTVTRLWDGITLTSGEDFVTETLRLIVGNNLERLAVVGDSTGPLRSRSRRVVAKLNSFAKPIPLKRLGNGALRLLGIAVALANCRNGILIIDEVENGIHYSLQSKLWQMIFKAADEGNVQVIAATHSWDCIASFAAAASETSAVGTLYRLERFERDVCAVQYSEDDLTVAAQQRIEVR
ncbi:MAG: AAA family ATPase [Albidovulum sp.]|nr:AAA family ATPase [Albidovulum sp.]